MLNTFEKNIINLLVSDDIEILTYDVFNDEVIGYEYKDDTLGIKNKTSLTSYIEEIKANIEEAYLKDFMNIISIPKLEEELKQGKEKISVTYKMLNGTCFVNHVMLIENNGNKLVLVIKEKQKEGILSGNKSDDAKYNGLIDLLSDSILKIQNVFNMDEKSISNIKNVEEYINSIFSILISNYSELKTSLNKTVANVTGRKEDTLLIVDDDKLTRTMIKKVFDGEYKIAEACNGKEAIEYLDSNSNKGFASSSDHVVGVFLDLTMPVMDGFSVLEYLSKKNYLSKVPVIIISGDYEKETKTRVYNYNIADMLEKPFDFEIVKHRIKNFVNLYKSSNSLNDLISSQNRDLKDLINPFVETYLYDYEKNITKVSKYVEILSKKVALDYPEYNLDEFKISKIVDAVKYYDVGFYSVPRLILSKNGNFTEEELKKIKEYPLFGSEMINYILSLTNDEGYKKIASNITKYYHENYDGTGYPEGLKGDEIPIESQISAVCIMYNNLLRKGISDAKNVIASKNNTMFNPKVISSFANSITEFENIN